MKHKLTILHFACCQLFISHMVAQPWQVRYTGAMRSAKQGDFSASLCLDTLPTQNLFAIGPVAALGGEILVWDGKPFVADVLRENGQQYLKKAPAGLCAMFLVYAQVKQWDTVKLTGTFKGLRPLQQAIEAQAAAKGIDTQQPFPFLLFGKIAVGKGHIRHADTPVLRVPAAVSDENKRFFAIQNKKTQMLGFFSKSHQGVFTHHDSFIHIHYRLYTKYEAGHLDEAMFDDKEPLMLLLPKG